MVSTLYATHASEILSYISKMCISIVVVQETTIWIRGEQKFRVFRSRPDMDPGPGLAGFVSGSKKKEPGCIWFQFRVEFCQTRYLVGTQFDQFRIWVPGGSGPGSGVPGT